MKQYSYHLDSIYKIKYNSFYLIKNNVFFINTEGTFCKNGLELLEGSCVINYIFDNQIYLWEGEDRYIYCINESILKKQIDLIYPLTNVYSSHKQYCLLYNKNNSADLYEYLDSDKGNLIKHKINLSFIINDLFYLITDEFKGIYCFNITKTLWDFKVCNYFNKPPKVQEGRVLVVEDRIIFFAHTEDWEQYASFVLDAHTGKVLFTTNQMGLKLFKYDEYIYQIQEKRIKKLNPKTLEIQTIEIEEKLDKRKLVLEDKSVCFHNNMLYVSAREVFSDVYNIWLIINLEKGEIEYQQEMLLDPNKKSKKNNKIFISNIQANKNLVAVRCTDHLYVFEKGKP